LHIGGWIALALSTCGAALIAMAGTKIPGQAKASVFGDLLVVLSMVAATAWILISQRLVQRHSATTVTAFVFWIGTLLLAIIDVSTSGVPSLRYSVTAWTAVAVQGIFATAVTTVLWNWGLKRVPASQAGIYVNLEPVIGTLLGVFLLHEALGIFAFIGGALIVGAAMYFTYHPTSTNTKPSAG
jgi:drug/metabolite transporter (DMT)-like permease